MRQIIDRKVYDTDTATLLADNKYWDGSNWERRGRNQFLYKTAKDNFFTMSTTQWQGESSCLQRVTRDEAMDLYESLREQRVEWAEAFGEVEEEA